MKYKKVSECNIAFDIVDRSGGTKSFVAIKSGEPKWMVTSTEYIEKALEVSRHSLLYPKH